MDIVERLRFDAARCEVQFSTGVAGNIEEAADTIERMRAALRPLARLQIPAKPQGNAGAYSILHDDIRRAQELCDGNEQTRGDQ